MTTISTTVQPCWIKTSNDGKDWKVIPFEKSAYELALATYAEVRIRYSDDSLKNPRKISHTVKRDSYDQRLGSLGIVNAKNYVLSYGKKLNRVNHSKTVQGGALVDQILILWDLGFKAFVVGKPGDQCVIRGYTITEEIKRRAQRRAETKPAAKPVQPKLDPNVTPLSIRDQGHYTWFKFANKELFDRFVASNNDWQQDFSILFGIDGSQNSKMFFKGTTQEWGVTKLLDHSELQQFFGFSAATPAKIATPEPVKAQSFDHLFSPKAILPLQPSVTALQSSTTFDYLFA